MGSAGGDGRMRYVLRKSDMLLQEGRETLVCDKYAVLRLSTD